MKVNKILRLKSVLWLFIHDYYINNKVVSRKLYLRVEALYSKVWHLPV